LLVILISKPTGMSNKKTTSNKVASLASQILQDPQASSMSKSLAGSALSQVNKGNQTGAKLEDLAAKVLHSPMYNKETHELAGSVLSQSNRKR